MVLQAAIACQHKDVPLKFTCRHEGGRDTSERQRRNALPGSQTLLLCEVLWLHVCCLQELCGAVKLNKQVNKIPWLSVTQECAEVDRRELICVCGLLFVWQTFWTLRRSPTTQRQQ